MNAGLIKYMASVSGDHDIVVPIIDGFYESLHAIYTKKCKEQVKDLILSGENQIVKLFDKCNSRKVNKHEIARFSDPDLIFKNINYIEDIDES